MVSTIRQLFLSRSRISVRVVGEPLDFGARTIRPVVRVSGSRGTGGDASAGVVLMIAAATRVVARIFG